MEQYRQKMLGFFIKPNQKSAEEESILINLFQDGCFLFIVKLRIESCF